MLYFFDNQHDIYVSIWVDIPNQDGVFVAIHTHVAIHTLLILMFIIIVKKFIVYCLNIYIYAGCAYM